MPLTLTVPYMDFPRPQKNQLARGQSRMHLMLVVRVHDEALLPAGCKQTTKLQFTMPHPETAVLSHRSTAFMRPGGAMRLTEDPKFPGGEA